MAAVTVVGSCCSPLVKELRQNFDSGVTRSYEWRAHQLKMVNKFLDEKETQIVEALHQDLSKPQTETYITEISMLRMSCQHTLKHLKSWMNPKRAAVSIASMPASAEIIPEPLGIVALHRYTNGEVGAIFDADYSSQNHDSTFLLSIDPVIGSIAAGNATVLKPSEMAPATSSLLASFVSEYLDSEAVRVVEGDAEATTALLEQKWDKIFFTGSTRIGRIVMAAASKHLTPVSLELGGKCPVIVDSNVDLETATKRIVMGKWGSNSGQTCIAPDYVVTTKDFAPKLVESLKRVLVSFFGDNPLESSDQSRIVNLNHFTRLVKLLDDERVRGKIVHGGQRDEKRLRIAPTLLLDVPSDSLIMNEEIFGPLLPIITVDRIEDSFDVVNLHPKPLAAYMFTTDKRIEKMFVDQISAGGMVLNDTIMHITNPSLPFGGVGESGMGAYHGKHSFDAFSHMKPVLYRSFIGEVAARHPPYSARKLRILKSLLAGDIIGVIIDSVGGFFGRHRNKD